MREPSTRRAGRKTGAGRVAGWTAAGGLVVGLEAALILGLAWVPAETFHPPVDPPIVVSLVDPPPPPPPAPQPQPAEVPAPAEAAPPAPAPRVAPPARPASPPRPTRRPPPPEVKPLPIPASVAPPGPPLPLIGATALAGATRVGAGPGGGGGGQGTGGGGGGAGGGCDMLKRLQEALRDDVEVRAAIQTAHREMSAQGRAIQVWDGDWLQSRGQEGKGLAGVRQAISVEVAFAPAECRAQAMRGLAVLALDDRADGAKLALGRAAWRWSDLLDLRR